MKRSSTSLAGVALVLAITALVFAEEKSVPSPTSSPTTAPPVDAAAPTRPAEFPATATGALDKFFNGKIPEAFTKGKFNLNLRFRYDFADQSDLPEDSNAATLRTRFGFTTAPLYGLQAMIEGENVVALNDYDDYNAAGSNGQPGRPVVADPQTTELNQVWLGYTYTNLLSAKLGRQRIVLDNQRFIGDVAWRQNDQTFDAAGLELNPIRDLGLYYSYVWEVNRVFGGVSGLPPANTDFDSNSSLLHAAYSGWKYGKLAAYSYLLDLRNAAGPNNSCASYGAYVAGSTPVSEQVKLEYRAEGAWQTDYADSTLNYGAAYGHVMLGAEVRPVAFGAGYELLGSENNVGFKTPLATLHAFDGWADVFLNTPNAGLQDLYAYVQVTLPKQIPVRFVYHKFDAATGGGNFGQEFDVVVSRKFGKYWNAQLKYAGYRGEDAAPPALSAANVDVQKFWAQLDFNF